MAIALLQTRHRLLAGAILFRPLSPFSQDVPTSLDGTPALIIDSAKDRRQSAGDGGRLPLDEMADEAGMSRSYLARKVEDAIRHQLGARHGILKVAKMMGVGSGTLHRVRREIAAA